MILAQSLGQVRASKLPFRKIDYKILIMFDQMKKKKLKVWSKRKFISTFALMSSGIQHVILKQKFKKELVKRTRLIVKTELNSKNRITVISILAVSMITYSFDIIDWNLREIKRLDVKVRKMMTKHSMHYPKADIHHVYLPISNAGRGLTQL